MLLSVAYCPPVEYFAALAGYSSVYVEACENYRRQTWRNRCRILTANGPMDLRIPVVHGGDRLITRVRIEYDTPWVEKTRQAIDSAYFSSPFFEYYRDQFFSIFDSCPETLWELDIRLTEFFLRKLGLGTELIPTTDFLPPAASTHAAFWQAVSGAGSLRSSLPNDVWAPPVYEATGGHTLPDTPATPAAATRGAGSLRSSLSNDVYAPPVYEATGGHTLPDTPATPAVATRGAGPFSPDLRYSMSPKVPSEYVGRPYWQVFREKFGFVGGLSVMDLLFNEGPESLNYLR